mmetsp:Transcript_17569/g.49905  ORF Transcript_17569/g.49905 Transcript_17569/m.49905 type:complete len:98 (-) Transcript_17569:562-855(-)
MIDMLVFVTPHHATPHQSHSLVPHQPAFCQSSIDLQTLATCSVTYTPSRLLAPPPHAAEHLGQSMSLMQLSSTDEACVSALCSYPSRLVVVGLQLLD